MTLLVLILLNNPEATFLPIFLLMLLLVFFLFLPKISNEDLAALLLGMDLLPEEGLIVLLSLDLYLVVLVVEVVQLKAQIRLVLEHLFQDLAVQRLQRLGQERKQVVLLLV